MKFIHKVHAATRKFNWKRPSASGSWIVGFRFPDEGRGERFIDSRYIARGEPGVIHVGGKFKHNMTVDEQRDHALIQSLKPGTILSVSVEFLSPRAKKYVTTLFIQIDDVKENEVNCDIYYTDVLKK